MYEVLYKTRDCGRARGLWTKNIINRTRVAVLYALWLAASSP